MRVVITTTEADADLVSHGASAMAMRNLSAGAYQAGEATGGGPTASSSFL